MIDERDGIIIDKIEAIKLYDRNFDALFGSHNIEDDGTGPRYDFTGTNFCHSVGLSAKVMRGNNIKVKSVTLGIKNREGKIVYPQEISASNLKPGSEMEKAKKYLDENSKNLFLSYSNSFEKKENVVPNIADWSKTTKSVHMTSGGFTVYHLVEGNLEKLIVVRCALTSAQSTKPVCGVVHERIDLVKFDV